MLHAGVTVAPAERASALRDCLAAAHEAGVLVDFAVVMVRPAVAPQVPGSAGTHGQVHAAEAAELDPVVPGGVAALLARYGARGSAGEVTEAPVEFAGGLVKVIFLGIGDQSAQALRAAGAVLGRRVSSGGTAVTVVPDGVTPDEVQAFAEGVLLGSYRYAVTSAGSSGGDGAPSTGAVRLLICEEPALAAVAAAVDRAATVTGAVDFARDLVNTPSVWKTPQWLATRATDLAEHCGLRIRVRGDDELAAGGFGGIVAVGSGSAHPPRLIELSYEPDGWDTHVVLVGKGITFDSGGLSLKRGDAMKTMKTDMAGGAAVMAVLSALRPLGVRAKVTGLVAAAENMPSGSAMRPGDVITQFGGRTVEVLNTDAEGRLVLADALAYADRTLDPHVIVDIATLTGAARVTLGTTIAALFTDDDNLAAALAQAAEVAGERLWRLPVAAEYRDALDSQVADVRNVGVDRYGRPGAIVAALFLREFSGRRSWAHLDIAGPARSASDEGHNTKGGTGFGTRLLLSWLAALQPWPTGEPGTAKPAAP